MKNEKKRKRNGCLLFFFK